MDNEQKEFIKYLLNKYKDLSENKIKLLKESGLLEKDYKEFKAKKTKKALHGTKLNYIRSLKNQCPEGEELVYYKKGGSVTCGCKKKEDGGEVTKAEDGWQAKFKNRKRTKAELDKINKQSEEDYFNGEASHSRISKSTFKKDKITGNILEERVEGKDSMYYERTPKGKMVSSSSNRFKDKNSRRDFESDRDYFHKDNKKINKKSCGGSAITKFKAACGKKLKKHRLGGSLNGIPFYLGGTPKGGVNPMYTSRKIGNISIEHTNDDLDKINDPNWERKYGAYSKWHIIDPNKGYNFEIHSGRLRDGGSQTLRSWGDSIPQELKNLDGLRGGLINYRGFKRLSPNDSTIIADRRNLVNSILSNYGLNFKE